MTVKPMKDMSDR